MTSDGQFLTNLVRGASLVVTARPFRVLSLCSGVGGLDQGVSLAVPHARTVCYVEGEAYAVAVLAARMADETLDAAPCWDNVRTFAGEPWRGRVDCVVGGYPCQPFSVAGKRKAEDDPRHLWPAIARILRECEPEWVFFENVGNHLSLGFETVGNDLQAMGYKVAAGLFTAAEVGAPHKRERLFILGRRKLAHDAGCGRVPTPLAGAGSDPRPDATTGAGDSAEDRGLRGDLEGAGTGLDDPGLHGWGSTELRIEQEGAGDDSRTGGTLPELADPGRGRVPGRDELHPRGVGSPSPTTEGERQHPERERMRDATRDGESTVGGDSRELADSSINGLQGCGQPGGADQGRETEDGGGRRSADASGELVNTSGVGRGEGWAESAVRGGGSATRGTGGDGLGLVGQADRGEQRLEGEFSSGSAAGAVGRGCGTEVPLWPPKPSDRAGWAAVLRTRPELAPAVASDPEPAPGERTGPTAVDDPLLRHGDGILERDEGGHLATVSGGAGTRGETGTAPDRQEATAEDDPKATQPPVRRVVDGLANRVDRLRAAGNGVVPVCSAYAFSLLADALEVEE